jgi:hypothetical protein
VIDPIIGLLIILAACGGVYAACLGWIMFGWLPKPKKGSGTLYAGKKIVSQPIEEPRS